MQSQGQDTPLDHLPEIDGFELWFYNTYYKLKGMSASEGLISITEFESFLNLYPVPINHLMFIDILSIIDRKATTFQREERKKEDALKKKSK